ncbi:dithiol-disulfide isomerase [Sporosarcina ureilytica]|uniref:ClpXP adapter protein SpxH n=1 Tax=Sporosarcina ureilytica TaxID=298596 RepID=A0A1D8JKN8_9BACL|nr:dithiol-disulfide isomerase [Sporosarcina ureilytica]
MENSTSSFLETRPLELYVFIDPACNDCWFLQPILRRLQIEYERYFTLRVVLRTSLPSLNLPSVRSFQEDDTYDKNHTAFPSIAIKAAEFQGKRAGLRFISKLFEYSHLKDRNVNAFSVLVEIAELVYLDIDEFIRDFASKNVHRALQIDLYMAKEMEVDSAPTFVFFNENIEDEGLKVSGLYSYEIYEQIIEELIGQTIYPETPPPLEELFKRFDTLATKEIAEIYRMTEKSAERELKKRLLQQHIERLAVQDITLWRKKV